MTCFDLELVSILIHFTGPAFQIPTLLLRLPAEEGVVYKRGFARVSLHTSQNI